ncbi:hypothetical protein QTP88_005088 [Uroleucon formosanum]
MLSSSGQVGQQTITLVNKPEVGVAWRITAPKVDTFFCYSSEYIYFNFFKEFLLLLFLTAKKENKNNF